eukprot:COSAG01_NODE_3914_length_5542_cov_47.046298_3_plen_75_part_00
MGYEVTYGRSRGTAAGPRLRPGNHYILSHYNCKIRTSTYSLTSAAKSLWEFGLAGSWSVTVSASRHRSTDLICM